MQLPGAHVLVTGASRGIGAAIASLASARGATVTLVARSAAVLAEQAGRQVDVQVNCAGTDALGGLPEVPREQVRRLYEVDLLAPVETPVLAFGWLPRRVADLVLAGVPRR